jgi:DNA-binding MarR family transcriptional regulator
MSRIIRSLEQKTPPLVVCGINANDKRKIDVNLASAGEQLLADYVAPRVQAIGNLLAKLNDEERENLAHLLDRLQSFSEIAVE